MPDTISHTAEKYRDVVRFFCTGKTGLLFYRMNNHSPGRRS